LASGCQGHHPSLRYGNQIVYKYGFEGHREPSLASITIRSVHGKKDGVLSSCPFYVRKLPKPYLGTRHLEEAINFMLFLNSFFLILFIFQHKHVIMNVKLCGVLANLVYAWYFQRQFLNWTIIPK
jgi:hypothetical protein